MKHHKRIKLEDGQNRDLHGPGAGAGVGTQVRGVGGGHRIGVRVTVQVALGTRPLPLEKTRPTHPRPGAGQGTQAEAALLRDAAAGVRGGHACINGGFTTEKGKTLAECLKCAHRQIDDNGGPG